MESQYMELSQKQWHADEPFLCEVPESLQLSVIVRRQIDERRAWLISIQNQQGKTIGKDVGWMWWDEARHLNPDAPASLAELGMIYIVPAWRRVGLARSALRLFESEVLAAGYCTALVQVEVPNFGARKLYEVHPDTYSVGSPPLHAVLYGRTMAAIWVFA
eukprot:gene677-1132_t